MPNIICVKKKKNGDPNPMSKLLYKMLILKIENGDYAYKSGDSKFSSYVAKYRTPKLTRIYQINCP